MYDVRNQDSDYPWKRAQRDAGSVLFLDLVACYIDAFTL